MQKVYKKEQQDGYEAFINGGCLHYRDPQWAYKIPVGKRTRFTLLKLEDNEQVTRSLTIDLLNGDVYYEIDNHTGSGLAYYYDMNSTKVWNNRILRLLHSIRDERLKPEAEIRKAIRSLPCAEWKEVLSVLPGWQEALDNRYERLFLPHEEPEQIRFSYKAAEGKPVQNSVLEQAEVKSVQNGVLEQAEVKSVQNGVLEQAEVKSSQNNVLEKAEDGQGGMAAFTSNAEAARTEQVVDCREFHLLLEEGKTVLRYINDNIGAEFFNEDEKYERVLNPLESAWAGEWIRYSGEHPDEWEQIRAQLLRFLRKEAEIVEQ